MPLIVVGVSHRTAPVEVRECFAVERGAIPGFLVGLVDAGTAQEAVLLSTCNRTELYAVVGGSQAAEAAVRDALAARGPGMPRENAGHVYVRRDRAVAEHLFRVTAGLDSMVVGEPQIQGQVREAYQIASEASATSGAVVGPTLNRLFQHALGVGGRVRSETGLGVGAASVSTAAVELAKKIFGSLQDRRALVLGAGEMSEVTLECLRAEGVRSTIVANRTFARASELADRWCGRAIRWEEFGAELPDVDIVICSTAAPHPVLTRERLREALPHGAKKPLCIIDIAIPRDVEPRVGDEGNVFLYNIDDLKQIVDATLGRRRSELPKAEALVEAAVGEFWGWFASLAVVPTIRDLRAHGESLRRSEVDRAMRRLAHLSEQDRSAVDQMTRALLNKLLHAPTVRLREAAGNGRGTRVLDVARYLFELDEAAEASAGERRAGQPGPSDRADHGEPLIQDSDGTDSPRTRKPIPK